MILESVLIVSFALLIDLRFGDPRNIIHPTSWMGSLISRLTPYARNSSDIIEKLGGVLIVLATVSIVLALIVTYEIAKTSFGNGIILSISSIVIGSLLLKFTIAIKGLEKHAMSVIDAIEHEDLDHARDRLSMLVKRNTKSLDKPHVISGVLESISENTVDGITGPLFYFSIFGLAGAFIYRTINTIDSMIGYRTEIFKNIGWFGANCDKVLNIIPSRLTSLIMVFAAFILKQNWKGSYRILLRDGKKTRSPNAGYPMAALAGAIGVRLEKIQHYSLGDGTTNLTREHVISALVLMKVTVTLFFLVVVIPIIICLSYLGWWLHA